MLSPRLLRCSCIYGSENRLQASMHEIKINVTKSLILDSVFQRSWKMAQSKRSELHPLLPFRVLWNNVRSPRTLCADHVSQHYSQFINWRSHYDVLETSLIILFRIISPVMASTTFFSKPGALRHDHGNIDRAGKTPLRPWVTLDANRF